MSENQVDIVRKVLRTHKIRADKHESIEKCVGCTWIGWHHDEHLAEEIVKAL